MNFGDMLEAVEAAIGPDEPAFIHGDTVIQWGEAARRSNNLARALIARGPTPGDKLAIYLRNGPDYLIAMAAAFKARLVPVNVNYRYGSGELTYLLDNADATAVVYGAEFRDRVDAIRDRLPGVRHWIGVGEADASDPVEALYDEGDGTPLRLARSPDDLHFIYTGGTTGMPKGVMWPHRDLWTVMVAGLAAQGAAVPDSAAALGAMIAAGARGPRLLPAPPLMHGTGMISALNALLWGGTVVTLTGATFDAGETLRAIERHRPTVLVIVGDSFARPLLDALDAAPGAHDLTSVTSILSSGVMWSVENKRGLLRHMPVAVLSDALSSSEALGLGASVMTADAEVTTARFMLGPRCRVRAEDGSWVAPGSGVAGMLALGPPNPLGYYKDQAKTDATLMVIDGVRYCIPGDWCRVEADGTLTFLGRGNACINTGGEKVFPEEVEEVLKTHASVADALVVGVPDPIWGQAIVAVVEPRADARLDGEALRAHVRERLAGYKVPKDVMRAAAPLRAVNGKADYAAARAQAVAARGVPA